jgi:putative PEP-CTERM system histidine kinase
MLSPIQIAVCTASAMLAAVIGLLALLRRGHWLTTMLFAASFLAVAAFQAGTLGLLGASWSGQARSWATYLTTLSSLGAWLWLAMSVVLGRPEPWVQVRSARFVLAAALVASVAFFGLAHTPWVVSSVRRVDGEWVLRLGAFGKIYLMYVVAIMVAVLMNLESTLRISPPTVLRRLRPMLLAFVIGIFYDLYVASTGLLYGELRAGAVAARGVPVFAAGVIAAFALARYRLSDLSLPLARPVVYYSSVSLTLAGAFLLTMAALSKVLPVLTPEWKRWVSLGFYLLAGGGGLVLTFSPRAARAVKRFVDRNFYANRYDYRREWERVSRGLSPTARPEAVSAQIAELLREVFEVDLVALYLRDDRSGRYLRFSGPAQAAAELSPENPLLLELARAREPIVLRAIEHDLDYIPLVVENRPLIQALNAEVCAALLVGDELVGTLWLGSKRNGESFSQEDVEFLSTMTRQLAGALWFARLGEQLAETRQLESLHRLSSFVLHDIKNQVSGLSLVVENARRHLQDPQFQRDAMAVVARTVDNLRELMSQVAGVARPARVVRERCRVSELVAEAVEKSGLKDGAVSGVQLDVRCASEGEVELDRGLMVRVLVNILTNAREALNGRGQIRVDARLEGARHGRELWLQVSDSGRGMSPDFVRESLFRPFASTKPHGLGIGLVQSKSIVEAHDGRIEVESRPGEGTTFSIRIPIRETSSEDEKVPHDG